MKSIFSAIGIIGFICVFLVIHFFPEIPRTIAGWTALILLGLPAWIFIEWLVEVVLGSRLFSNLSSTARVILGVPTVIILGSVALLVIAAVHLAIEAVGG
ncbi:hypothetical protein [Pseudoalteromonas luteoviolacea]|uniref:hypothetical protein n=1 Tax=Pseudoalteromonas luteoviolacea TaxID=43657 RepID=UPI0011531F5E|nr:hypothetical protein [Pseudoalteromonas luteoviolacea]TQF70021.1 hypothetical protein FLM44_02705 [Pseudoalteromonas luteoviolacea]